MVSANLELARRLESAEGYACLRFAQAHHRVFPESGAAWLEHAGVYAGFVGIDSPLTQSFGLGIQQPLTSDTLDIIEQFFTDRDTAPIHEVSPLAGCAALDLLCQRGYRPVEISNVLYRTLDNFESVTLPGILARPIQPTQQDIWNTINTRAWTDDHPELEEFLESHGSHHRRLR
ncbi:MAG: hypothetical protein WDO18_13265 [Acidobacteriota bacterium]